MQQVCTAALLHAAEMHCHLQSQVVAAGCAVLMQPPAHECTPFTLQLASQSLIEAAGSEVSEGSWVCMEARAGAKAPCPGLSRRCSQGV